MHFITLQNLQFVPVTLQFKQRLERLRMNQGRNVDADDAKDSVGGDDRT